jgi:hypothetical protein
MRIFILRLMRTSHSSYFGSAMLKTAALHPTFIDCGSLTSQTMPLAAGNLNVSCRGIELMMTAAHLALHCLALGRTMGATLGDSLDLNVATGSVGLATGGLATGGMSPGKEIGAEFGAPAG